MNQDIVKWDKDFVKWLKKQTYSYSGIPKKRGWFLYSVAKNIKIPKHRDKWTWKQVLSLEKRVNNIRIQRNEPRFSKLA